MDTLFLGRIRDSLLEKRQHLMSWLDRSSTQEKDCRLGCEDESCVQPHLEVIETSLQKIENHQLGICKVCGGKISQNLIDMDYTTSICLDCMPDEDKRDLERELDFSQKLQHALLSPQFPVMPGMDLAVFSRPAQVLSGDYFDVLQFPNDTYGLVVADAMGHGLSASIVMTSLQTAFRTLSSESLALEEILARINRLYLHNSHFTIFATMVLSRFNPLTHNFTYCNAGHNPPVLFQGQYSTIKWLDPTGPAVGIVEDYKIQAASERLSPGDIVVLYSDGVTEAINPQEEEFGRERLAELIQRYYDRDPQELINIIKQALHTFVNGQPIKDDTTLVVCKVQVPNL
jgi:sigma-B regulation protein RsbU (phosphoserine phosphatase)